LKGNQEKSLIGLPVEWHFSFSSFPAVKMEDGKRQEKSGQNKKKPPVSNLQIADKAERKRHTAELLGIRASQDSIGLSRGHNKDHVTL
jgi:hypothetical protein